MTTDEIIDCLETTGLNQEFVCQFYEEMKLFAKLVAQHEREECAKICETLELPGWPDKVRQPLAKAIRARGQTSLKTKH